MVFSGVYKTHLNFLLQPTESANYTGPYCTKTPKNIRLSNRLRRRVGMIMRVTKRYSLQTTLAQQHPLRYKPEEQGVIFLDTRTREIDSYKK
jgi:hypothetical protein